MDIPETPQALDTRKRTKPNSKNTTLKIKKMNNTGLTKKQINMG